MRCSRCTRSMRKVADSPEKLGTPQTPRWSDYRCPNCGATVRFEREKYTIKEGQTPHPDALSLTQLNRVRLVFSDLREFHDGYVHIERFALTGHASFALLRFFEEALTAKLDGFYQDRREGMLAVLEMVHCPLVKAIGAALDTPIGNTTYQRLLNDYRDKSIAHPQFRMNHQRAYLQRTMSHLTSDQEIEAFRTASRELKKCTAAAYVWLETKYPQLSVDADDTEDRAADEG